VIAKIAKYVLAFFVGIIFVIVVEFAMLYVHFSIAFRQLPQNDPIQGAFYELQTVAVDIRMYSVSHHGKLPVLKQDLLASELDRKDAVPESELDPIRRNMYVANPYYSGYVWNKMPNPKQTAILYTSFAGKDGSRAVLCADLTARIVSEGEWDTVKKDSHIE